MADKKETCSYCEEKREDVQVNHTYQQWHCGCCGSWNDLSNEEDDVDWDEESEANADLSYGDF